MAGVLQHLRSSTLDKRPNPASMVDGQVAINYASGAPGMFFKDSNGSLVKVGPVHVGSGAPNAVPASGGTAGNSLGEQWLDTSGGTYVFKIWDGSAWRSEAGEFVNVTGDTMTGALGIIAGSAASPSLFISGDANTGLYSPGADQLALATNGTQRVNFGTGEVVFNDGGENYDFRIEGDTQANLLFVDASTDRVGVGTSSPGSLLSLAGSSAYVVQNSGRALAGIDLQATAGGSGLFGGAVSFGVGGTGRAAIAAIQGTTDNDVVGLGFFGHQSGTAAADAVEFMRIDGSTGRVGIGTTSPIYSLDVASTGSISAAFTTTSSENYIALKDSGTTLGHVRVGSISNNLTFRAGNAERARIDSSGRLLVGTSTARSTGFLGSGQSQIEASNTYAALQLFGNVNSTSGSYIGLWKSRGTSAGGTTVVQNNDELGGLAFGGYDGTNAIVGALISANVDGTPGANDMPGRLVFSTTADGASSPTERMRIKSDGILVKYGDTNSARIVPQTDNAGYLGESSFRWQAVYAVNGTIQTSDEREKTEVQTSALGADFIRSLRPVSYKWKVGGYTSTWDDEGNETVTPNPGVRTHYGFIAQEVKQACGETDFGGWLQEDLHDPESMQSLRLHEFISPIVKALQEALDEIDTLKAEVAALKGA